MRGRQGAGAEAGLEPAPEPEPAPAAGRAAPEHCCRGGRSSGYWVPPLTFHIFFLRCVVLCLGPRRSQTIWPYFTSCSCWS
jgi:hypothetical protein